MVWFLFLAMCWLFGAALAVLALMGGLITLAQFGVKFVSRFDAYKHTMILGQFGIGDWVLGLFFGVIFVALALCAMVLFIVPFMG